MNIQIPPITVIKISKKHGSMGYGAKTDGNDIYIPFNPSVIHHLGDISSKTITMSRIEFSKLPDYIEEEKPKRGHPW